MDNSKHALRSRRDVALFCKRELVAVRILPSRPSGGNSTQGAGVAGRCNRWLEPSRGATPAQLATSVCAIGIGRCLWASTRAVRTLGQPTLSEPGEGSSALLAPPFRPCGCLRLRFHSHCVLWSAVLFDALRGLRQVAGGWTTKPAGRQHGEAPHELQRWTGKERNKHQRGAEKQTSPMGCKRKQHVNGPHGAMQP